ncbi:MAG: sugar phosphate isomerase/epimerase [Eubacteriales bacterium]|nr:sugar phosphate isomerase/epimerase [Eubacteriales bacterium]
MMMNDFKIGVIADSFRVGIDESIKKAAGIGAQGLQLYATSGEMSPENLSARRKREILDRIESNGMVVSAICGDMGGHGFEIASDNTIRIEKSKRIMELAKELKSNIVTTHIGVIPSDENHSRWTILAEACKALGTFAQNMGSYFAIETGPEKAVVLKKFLDAIGSKGLAVNYDPANLVMVTGDDPVEGVRTLKDYIVHTHAKDGIMIKQTDPEIIYNHFAEGGIEDLNLKDYFLETPLGEGKVDFTNYLKVLSKSGFNGFLTIEREVGSSPAEDITLAVNFLKRLIAK